MPMNGVNGIDETANMDSSAFVTQPRGASRPGDTSLMQETMSLRPEAVEGDRRSRYSAAGAQGEAVSPADHAQQVMSPRVSTDA